MIYDFLRNTTSHPKAEDIYSELKKKIPSLSLATVYRNLHLFEKEQRAIKINCLSGSQSYDADTSQHYHFECRVCGKVYDVPMPLLEGIEKSAEMIGTADSHSLIFYGVCNNCKK